MNIFYRRPLCIILFIILGGFSVFPFLSPIPKAIFAISALLLLLVSSFFTIKKHKVTFFSICCALLVSSIILSLLYFDFYAKPEERYEGRVAIDGKIHEVYVIDEEDRVISYTIRTSKIDNKTAVYKLRFTTSGDYIEKADVGDNVSLSGILTDYSASDKEMRDYYFSLGILGSVDEVTNIEIVSSGLKPLSYYTSALREALTKYSISVSSEASGTMLSALLFGERQELAPSVKASFTNIGISHILALSGMHVTLLCLAISRLLMLCRVRRRERLVATIVICIGYMILTGISISVVRASIMMIISQALALLFKSSDSITSLFISVFVIIFFAPYSVYSVSLWLSAFATLGVILALDFADIIPYKKNALIHILRFISASAISSVFAMMSTILISSLIFKKISSLSIISTLIFSILTEIIMYIGAVALIIGKLIPISFILNPVVNFTVWLAEQLAGIKNAVISTNTAINSFLVLTTAIFAVLLVVKIKSKKALLITVVGLLAFSTLPIIVYGAVNADDFAAYYTSDVEEDVIIIKDAERCHVISYGSAYRNNAYEVYDALLEKNIHSIDTYVLFDISENTEREISSLLSKIPVNTVLMPDLTSEKTAESKLQLEEYLSKNSVALEYFSENKKYETDSFSFLPLICKGDTESSSNVAFLTALYGKNILYLSSGILKDELKSFLEGAIPLADTLIFGKYGSSYSENHYLEEYYENLDEIIFSGDKIYLTPDTATWYIENGCKLTSHPSTYRLFN